MKAMGWFKDAHENARDTFDYKLAGLELDVSENILEIMERKNVIRSELPGKLGVSKAAVSKLFNNGSNMTLRTLLKITDALDCDVGIKMSSRSVESSCVGCVKDEGSFARSHAGERDEDQPASSGPGKGRGKRTARKK
jgi:DNA-binding Xre family transcriptional regulator